MLGQCTKPWASINAVLAQRLVGHDIIIIIHDMSCFSQQTTEIEPMLFEYWSTV